MLEKQRTISNPASLSGIGLHTGNRSTMTFKPAPENYGIKFVRVDLENSPEIPADIDHVVDISRGTTLGLQGVEVRTVEHVLAAIAGLEIDNIIVELDTNEPPVMDGSAIEYVKTLNEAHIVEQDANKDDGEQKIDRRRQTLAGQEISNGFNLAHTRDGLARGPGFRIAERQAQQMIE